MIKTTQTQHIIMSTAEKPVDLSIEIDQKSIDPAFGWTKYAEQINGRFAMAGFVLLLVLEFFTKQDIITWLGLR
jgi:Chlorophyll A-B binding protein